MMLIVQRLFCYVFKFKELKLTGAFTPGKQSYNVN